MSEVVKLTSSNTRSREPCDIQGPRYNSDSDGGSNNAAHDASRLYRVRDNPFLRNSHTIARLPFKGFDAIQRLRDYRAQALASFLSKRIEVLPRLGRCRANLLSCVLLETV